MSDQKHSEFSIWDGVDMESRKINKVSPVWLVECMVTVPRFFFGDKTFKCYLSVPYSHNEHQVLELAQKIILLYYPKCICMLCSFDNGPPGPLFVK